jgi:hypothetical protein
MDEFAISSVKGSPLPASVWDATPIPVAQVSNTIPAYYSSGNSCSSPTCASTALYMYESSPSRNHSPESHLSVSSTGSPQQYPERFNTASYTPGDVLLPMEAANVSYSQISPSEELTFLRERVRQLEEECRRAKLVLDRLCKHAHRPPLSHSFQVGWQARTAARMKRFCSPNRAGNALCAWHDSRRERRAYPARNAPDGFLNCGCTYEEALFEESLSQHGVGGYFPGEAVRMDPALRNPLLRLLKERYGYKDGDFEHDPMTETWMESQSPEDWQRMCREGKPMKVRKSED